MRSPRRSACRVGGRSCRSRQSPSRPGRAACATRARRRCNRPTRCPAPTSTAASLSGPEQTRLARVQNAMGTRSQPRRAGRHIPSARLVGAALSGTERSGSGHRRSARPGILVSLVTVNAAFKLWERAGRLGNLPWVWRTSQSRRRPPGEAGVASGGHHQEAVSAQLHAEQQLWRAVPQRDYLVRVPARHAHRRIGDFRGGALGGSTSEGNA